MPKYKIKTGRDGNGHLVYLHIDVVVFILHSNRVRPSRSYRPDLTLILNFCQILIELTGPMFQLLCQMSLRLFQRRLAVFIAQRDKRAIINQ